MRAILIAVMQLSQIHYKDINGKESRWHIVLAIFAAIGLGLLLSNQLTFNMKYAIAALELLLIILLIFVPFKPAAKRFFAIVLLAIISIVNLISLGLVISALFGGLKVDGHELLISSVAIYLTNIIVFGLWYWELDNTHEAVPDFLFPQQTNTKVDPGWKPTFFDYLYISVTNATAFSPTDTLPLTHRGKLLMGAQSIVSLVTVALVVARAVNILS
ncbi:MAG: putative rane protein [Candidatus Saccharibacteria bacterium]|nr:putative rane protein [Candidatus Saccharibacteria bacterium]